LIEAQITSITEVFEKKFFDAGVFRKTIVKPSKTIEKPISYSAFESRDDGLSNCV
jgi:hypothetical protein